MRAGFELIAQARGDYVTTTLRPNPIFNIDQTLLPLGAPFTEDAQGGPPQLDVGLAFPIDWFLFGKRAAAMLASRLGVNATEAEFANLIRERVLDAATAYYDVLEAKALLEVAKQDAANYRRVEGITEKATEGGGRPRVELSRIRLDRLQSEQRVREAELALVEAKAALRAVMGRSEPDPDFDVAGTLDDIRPIDPLPTEEAFAVALENRPDLEALRLRIAEANAQIVVERRDGFPEVLPRAGYTRQFQQKAIGFPDVSSFGFGVEMTLPIFNRNQGNRLKAAAVAAQQSYELQAGIVDVRAEVVTVEMELKTAAANAKAVAEEQLKLAIEVRETLNKAYSLGGRPLIDVLDAQRNYRETYRIFVESRANYGRAVARYNATLGKRITP